jgi:NAD(P)-dependent dehydrogenase (short-subunit alcohol dehydrogenase family)
MAVDYARRGVRVNAVSPGFVESEMLTAYIEAQDDPAAAKARFADSASLRRIGRPEEIADAVVFLASDDAAFITGANLVVDGGNMANGMRAVL